MPLCAVAVCLLGLDLLRIAIRGKASEAKVSVLCLPAALILSSWVIREVRMDGFPVYQAVVGPVCIVLYTYLSGRDFSFIGCLLLSLIASSASVAAISNAVGLDRKHAAFALGTNFIFVTYLVYDLASLLARRRRGEELAAVVDLYRDVFNFFGYAVRMVKHWRKHRIWTVR
jgi:FtsH-binding integral membrane protein